ncbi:putative metal-dependent membrane protease [Rubellimicrobium thermophilum DSM 16684]|uniref:Putative metal-dependent membrane protease n=1 Tax=Rubellimicrobium thermophilum DSM 16684 TaxID=1123069 RepID=S9R2U8_9RHOB|nr:CPBP family intramembrane glutamic endopeptidase [Rubellimicrobium thermophilum]EPX86303.1 putative metal-dependent membrane protease [Rubellimicrobium thermophilum DSM 16684]
MPPGRYHRPAIAVTLLLAWMSVGDGFGRMPLPGEGAAEWLVEGMTPRLLAACLLLAGAAALLRWRGLGLGLPRREGLIALWPAAIYIAALALMAAAAPVPAGLAAALLWPTLLIALSEEGMFRGFLYAALRDRFPVLKAGIIVSVLFGAVHVLNVQITGNLPGALLQSLNAGMLGLYLLGLRLRSGSIWPSVVVHWLWNLPLFLLAELPPPPTGAPDPPPEAALLLTLAILPLGLHGAFALRRAARRGDGLTSLPPPLPRRATPPPLPPSATTRAVAAPPPDPYVSPRPSWPEPDR